MRKFENDGAFVKLKFKFQNGQRKSHSHTVQRKPITNHINLP